MEQKIIKLEDRIKRVEDALITMQKLILQFKVEITNNLIELIKENNKNNYTQIEKLIDLFIKLTTSGGILYLIINR